MSEEQIVARGPSEQTLPSEIQQKQNVQSKGTPSDGLKRMKEAQRRAQMGEPGVLDVGSGGSNYEPLTESNPEAGVYSLVGGYLDRDGELHKEVEIKAMTGHEEDMLGDRKIPIVLRLNAVLSNVVTRLGTITDRGDIARAVKDMPIGSRQHLLICMRVTSHWKTEKDMYDFRVRCPNRSCGKEGNHKLDLLSLENYEPEEPSRQVYEVTLPYSEKVVTWRVLPGEWDHALDMLQRKDPKSFLTHAIMGRVLTLDGQGISLSLSDILSSDLRKVKLSKRGQAVQKLLKGWHTGDRDFLRAQFLEHEPGIDTDIECECEYCGTMFTRVLDVGQESFFFPQATSMRSKTRSFS